MKVNITYPTEKTKMIKRADMIRKMKWPFMFAAYICPIINILVGGKAWSIIVLWSLWIVWTFAFSTTLVEYNRLSQFIKFITNTSILLIIIDIFISSGWAIIVVPILGFTGIIVSGALFFTDIEKQKQNMMPMLKLIFVSIVCSIVGLIIFRNESYWALIVMGALAFVLLAASIKVLGFDFFREMQKRFHIS